MSYHPKISNLTEKYTPKISQVSNKSRTSQGMSKQQLKEFIENEVYDILGGIKAQLEVKMKEVDINIAIIKNEIIDLKKTVSMKSNSPTQLPNEVENSLRELFSRMDKIQKEVTSIKNVQSLGEFSYLNSGDASKSHISTFQLNQSGQKSHSKQKNNSPLFKKTNNQGIDLVTLIFEDDKVSKTKNEYLIKQHEQSPVSKSKEKKAIFSNTPQQNLRKPPLPSNDPKPKFSTSYDMSTSSSFYDQPQRIQGYEQSRANQYILSQFNPIEKVQKELSKNKSVLLRKKKSEEKIESPPLEDERNFPSHRFENQLEEFSPKEDESFNIELEYSKDTFLSDL